MDSALCLCRRHTVLFNKSCSETNVFHFQKRGNDTQLFPRAQQLYIFYSSALVDEYCEFIAFLLWYLFQCLFACVHGSVGASRIPSKESHVSRHSGAEGSPSSFRSHPSPLQTFFFLSPRARASTSAISVPICVRCTQKCTCLWRACTTCRENYGGNSTGLHGAGVSPPRGHQEPGGCQC